MQKQIIAQKLMIVYICNLRHTETKRRHFVCQNMKHVASTLSVLFEIKYKTAKHENAEKRTMSHECKFNVQMLINPNVFVEKNYL